jgi:uncharacterized membrane protein YphA (DoxX/SURF4 family)
MTVAPSDVIQISVIGDYDGTEDVVNTYQFKHTSGTSISDTDFLLDWIALMRALYDAFKAIYTTIHVFRRIRAQNLTTGLLVGEMDFSTVVTGTATSSGSSAQSAALVVLKTNVPRVVMRKYIPVGISQIGAGSALVAGARTLLETFGSALLVTQTGVSGHTYKFGFLSPKTTNFEEPLSRAVQVIVATQRRRRPGVGS